MSQRQEGEGGPGQAGDARDPGMVRGDYYYYCYNLSYESLIKHLFTG